MMMFTIYTNQSHIKQQEEWRR